MLSIAAATLLAVGAIAQEHHRRAEKTFVGHVVDASCQVSRGAIGESRPECAETCAKAAISLAIRGQQTGTLYPPLAKSRHEAANKGLIALVEKDVRVSGTVAEQDGLKTISIESIAAAD